MTYLKDFQERLADGNYPSFLQLWEEYCYSEDIDSKELSSILEEIKASSLSISFGNHVERSLCLWKQIQEPEGAEDVLRLIMDLQTTNSPQLATLAMTHLKNKYGSDPTFHEKIRIVGLRSKNKFQSVIRNFELLNHFAKGKFVFHTSGWGTGEIADVSILREELSLEFDLVVGLRSLSFENAFKTLIPLDDDHFLSRRFGDPDLLEKQAKQNPLEVIHCLLRDLGPKTAQDIKEEMCDLVIPQPEWNRWWQTTRAKIKKDTKIKTPKSINMPFVLREKELPHEMALHKALENKPSIDETIQMIYTYLRDFSETLKNKEFKSSLEKRLQDVISSEELKVHHKLQVLFFLKDLGLSHDDEIKRIITTENPSALIKEIFILTFKKKVLQLCKSYRDDWEEIFLSELFAVEINMLRDFILQVLIKEDKEEKLKTKLQELLINPTLHPDVFLWYFQKINQKDAKIPYSDVEGKNRFFENILILLDYVEKKPESRDIAKKIITLVTSKRYQLLRDILEHSPITDTKEYLLLATKCESFTDHDIKIIHSLAQVVHPSLETGKGVEEEESFVLWSTEEGLEKLKKRMEQIATIETVQNAKEIEAARELGDLKENAEYKAAQEKRARLQSELHFLSSQLNNSRVLTPEDVAENEVGPGNIVVCTDSSGKKSTFTLLGPFDADPEKNIISFQSKLAKEMAGKKIGEHFSFQSEKYTIEDISNYFSFKS